MDVLILAAYTDQYTCSRQSVLPMLQLGPGPAHCLYLIKNSQFRLLIFLLNFNIFRLHPSFRYLHLPQETIHILKTRRLFTNILFILNISTCIYLTLHLFFLVFVSKIQNKRTALSNLRARQHLEHGPRQRYLSPWSKRYKVLGQNISCRAREIVRYTNDFWGEVY